MTVLRDISFLWAMLFCILLFLLLFEPRYPWKNTLIASFTGSAVLFLLNVLLMVYKGPAIIMHVAAFTCTLPSMLLFFILSKYRDGRFFFLFCLTDTTTFWLLQVTNFLDRLLGDTYVVMFVSRILLCIVTDLLFWRYLRKPYLELQRRLAKGWWLFAAIGAVYYLLIMFTSVPVGTPMPDMMGLIRIILVLILMPLTYWTVLRSLWQQMQEAQARTEVELLTTRNELTYENLRILQASAAALAQVRHDMLGNLTILQTLSQEKNYEKLEDYLARITRQTWDIVPLRFTGHPIVNAILTQGAERARDADIEFHCQVNLPDTLPIPDEDLAAFLMNLLSNALDAAGAIPPGRPRWVEVTIHIRGKYLFMEGQNTYGQAPEPDKEGGRFHSRKGANHGYGLKIMEGIACRYESELQTEAKDGIFLARTALLMPEQA